MAAIDKIYISSYDDFNDFRIWCIKYKPDLLWNFYNAFYTWKDWDESKEQSYNLTFKKINDFCLKYPRVDDYLKTLGNLSVDRENYERTYWLDMHDDWSEMAKNKDDWKYEHEIPITNFSLKQDKWLLWHCPIKFVREYLKNNCGYKTKWYHKLFWKGKKYV